MENLPFFRFWCYKVLPLVYDDSLSYMEILCKVVEYINSLIETDKAIFEDIAALQRDLRTVQKWIADYNTAFAEKVIRDYLATMIFVEISDAGYFVYYIPETWDDIRFQTTGLDVNITGFDYGRLVLSY